MVNIPLKKKKCIMTDLREVLLKHQRFLGFKFCVNFEFMSRYLPANIYDIANTSSIQTKGQ